MILGVIGCGNMGSAIIKGAISTGVLTAESVILFDKDKAKTDSLSGETGCSAVDTVIEVIERSDAVLLGVKPQNIKEMAKEIESSIFAEKNLISILAGTKIKVLRSLFPESESITRVMPNLALRQGAGMTAISFEDNITDELKVFVSSIFDSCGEVIFVQEEMMDAVTAVSGSGPAYYFYITELITKSAIDLGFDPETAVKLAKMTAFGAAKVMINETTEPGTLREQVTSPGGTTQAALDKLMNENMETMFSSALSAARDRSIELSSD